MSWYIDFETRSRQDLPKVGAYRYAECPDALVLLAAVSSDAEGPFLWVHPLYETELLSSDPRASKLIAEMRNSDELVYAHNAGFERAVGMFMDTPLDTIDPSRWRCTQAMARKAQIPDSLELAAKTLGLNAQKDARGKALIKQFSIPREDGTFMLASEDPKAFAEFGDYCLQDCRVERELHKKLAPFELSGIARDAFLLDITLNDRGIPVNVPALRNAAKILDEVYAEKNAEFRALTGLNPTQREAVRQWCNDRGAGLENMQGVTLDAWLERGLEHSTQELRSCVEIYSDLNFAAAKKVNVMLDCVNADGFVRGTLLWHGAGTGRWSGRLIQPQNFKKPTIKDTNIAYRMICDGCTRADLELVFGNPLEVIASCVRHFIQFPVGDMLDADYNAVECRIVNWLAGEESVLKEFREGKDPYKRMAGVVYGRSPESIQNPSPERNLGKTTELGSGFGMGSPKFLTTCHKYGLTFVTEALAEKAIDGYRSTHKKVVKSWYAHEEAARAAIIEPNKWFAAGDFVQYSVRTLSGMPFLLMRLPSGRCLSYPQPKLEKLSGDRREGITFWGKIIGTTWGRCRLYGGMLVENATQACAADLMTYGACNALRLGFDIFTLIHDQALAKRLAEQNPKGFAAALSALPPWAKTLPLAAEAKIVPYYTKT